MLCDARKLATVAHDSPPAGHSRLCVQNHLAEIGLAIVGEIVGRISTSIPELQVKLHGRPNQVDWMLAIILENYSHILAIYVFSAFHAISDLCIQTCSICSKVVEHKAC